MLNSVKEIRKQYDFHDFQLGDLRLNKISMSHNEIVKSCSRSKLYKTPIHLIIVLHHTNTLHKIKSIEPFCECIIFLKRDLQQTIIMFVTLRQ